MKPRGLPAIWRRSKNCLTYAFEKGQPSRQQELRDAIKSEEDASTSATPTKEATK